MKKYIFLAVSALTLASCSSDDFLGDTPGSTPTSANSAIKFDGNAGKISRVTSNTASTVQGKLDYQFKIYGVKSGTDNKYSKVFEDYNIWWNTTKTTSNTNDWEYVSDAMNITTGDTQSPTNIKLNKKQTIKYWDYASTDYHFVAGSPIENFDYKLDQNGNIASAEIKGLGGHITANTGTANTFNPVYVAKPKVVAKEDYQKPVQFEFVRQQSMVRVGIYETIPGYEITDIKFYKQGENGLEKVDATNNIILTSTAPNYFVGGTDVTGTITYYWTPTPGYTFNYTGTYTQDKNWYAGAITGVQAKSSAETAIDKLYGTDGDMDTQNGYFIVMPTLASQASAILIKCDYTLKSTTDGSNEEIHVKGATAAIPAAYSKWDINTRYTYLFKISENTNGTTGDPTNDPSGLYPITFAAAVTEMTDKDKLEGTTTTFTAPSITTYQKGSVEGNTIKYVANKNIDVTVLNDKAEIQTLKTTDETVEEVGHIAVYKFDTEITEAELQVKVVTGKTTVIGNVKNNVFTFKPTAKGWYAIKYLAKAAEGKTPVVYTYKVVYVADATK